MKLRAVATCAIDRRAGLRGPSHLLDQVQYDGAQVAAVLGRHAPLPLVSGAALDDLQDVGQLRGAAQFLGDGFRPRDRLAEMVGDQLFVASGVENDDGVQAIAGGAPFVFLPVPGRHGGNRATVVQRRGKVVDEALCQGSDGTDFLKRARPSQMRISMVPKCGTGRISQRISETCR